MVRHNRQMILDDIKDSNITTRRGVEYYITEGE